MRSHILCSFIKCEYLCVSLAVPLHRAVWEGSQLRGDSNTFNGGDDCTDERGWNTWFRRVFRPATCKSYARSGATWTNTNATVTNTQEKIDVIGNNNVIYNQIVRLKQAHAKGQQPAPHLIIIAAGTNDAWFTKHRPQAYDKTARQVFADSQTFTTKRNVNTVLTLAESVRYCCEMLMEAFPCAQLVLVTPPQCVKVDSDKMLLTGDIIEQCGEYMGIGVIRLDKIGAINATRERQQKHYTADGVHTNRLGARRNGTIIARQVGATRSTAQRHHHSPAGGRNAGNVGSLSNNKKIMSSNTYETEQH